jgi:DNA-binding NarL/FixJ family response regulator
MSLGEPIRIVLADDHAIVRQALAHLLDSNPDLTVVGQADDGASAIEVIRESRPDVLVLDVDMPGQDVLTTARVVRVTFPDTAILVLSMADEPDLVRNLLAIGVRGYMLKSTTQGELVAAIRSVHDDAGRVVLSVSGRTLGTPAVANPLSARECDVLRLVAEAKTNRQIGHELSLAESTVKRHLHSSFVKLDAVSRLDAVTKAVEAGIINPSRPLWRRSLS